MNKSRALLSHFSVRALFLVVTVGCGESSMAPVIGRTFSVQTHHEVIARSDALHITFRNLSTASAVLDHCPMQLERQDRSTWVAADGRFSCDAVLSQLGPNDSLVVRVKLPAVESGVYRMRFDVRNAARVLLPESDRLSNAFQLR